EKADSLGLVGDLEEAKGTIRALGDLAQSHEHADDADGQEKDAQEPPFPVTEQKCAEENGQRRQQRHGAEPCRARRDADWRPGELAREQLEGRSKRLPVWQCCPERRRERNELEQWYENHAEAE